MRCTSPLYRVKGGENVPPFIKRKIYGYKDYFHFVNNCGVSSNVFTRINCGQCLSCRINKAREWAERCYLEHLEYNSNYFITLTYNDEHLTYVNDYATLVKRDVQLFIKRLRKWCEKVGKPSPRYFMAGEYGETTFRPHYHLLLFNFELNDLQAYKTVRKGNDIYIYQISPIFEKLWGKGFCVISKIVPETCAYTAQYALKKIGMLYNSSYAFEVLNDNNKSDEQKFNALCSLGVIQKPFQLQSTKPGIGGAFCSKNIEYILATDNIPGAKVKTIRYFDKLLERANPVRLEELKDLRAERCEADVVLYDVTEEQQNQIREHNNKRMNKKRSL